VATAGLETMEFRHAFVAETDRVLRRRLVWFIAIWGGLGLLGLLFVAGVSIHSATTGSSNPYQAMFAGGLVRKLVVILASIAWFAGYGATLLTVLRNRRLSRVWVVRLSIGLILLDGLFVIVLRAAGIPGYNLAFFWLSHLIACCVFPWTVWQAVSPVIYILAISALSKIGIEGKKALDTLMGVVAFMLFATPAVFICWYRFSQRMQVSSAKFFQHRYGMLRQELAYARQIHESLFPQPIADGPVRLSYRYEPMRQIGGDYLHCVRTPDGRLSVVVLDVTGHGIPAALTVNRLYGEIDLRFADEPDISPGELLARLNRYVHLTLAKHSIYVTALCMRVDPNAGTVEYASGGHPPAFLRGSDGTVRELMPTTFVLGACRDKDFDPAQTSVEFLPGDSLVAYTDGAIEARGPDGKMLRIAGFQAALATSAGVPNGSWAEHLLALVAGHRAGAPPEDDTLVLEIYRPAGAERTTGELAEAAAMRG
jgi:hypothetical protein